MRIVTKSHKGNKACDERKVFSVGEHMYNVPKETRVVSVMTLASENNGKGQRRKGRSSSPASHSKATDGEEQKSSHGSGHKQQKLERQE